MHKPALLVTAFLVVSTTGLPSNVEDNFLTDDHEDLITNLPGLPANYLSRQYSGYLQADNETFFHYWFFESQKDPETAPLLLWLNGGPGCSSMGGLFEELGPLIATPDGETLVINPNSWNTFANLIFMESPACVGYSYNTKGDCHNSDKLTATRNYNALVDFFKKFPQFKSNELFVTGESYSGIYVPTLSVKIIENIKENPMNFKGYAIGNGLLSWRLNYNSLMFFANYHGLLDQEKWDQLVSSCCVDDVEDPNKCDFYVNHEHCLSLANATFYNTVFNRNLDFYDLYSRCRTVWNTEETEDQTFSSDSIFKSSYLQKYTQMFMRKHQSPADELTNEGLHFPANEAEDEVPFCERGWGVSSYMNRQDVREAIHIPSSLGKWQVCNLNVNRNWVFQYADMVVQFKALKAAGVRGLVYNGDVDMACNYLGDQWFVEALGWKVNEPRRMWLSDNQVGGFVKRFELLDQLTVRGSGHFVPMDKPGPALQMIKAFVYENDY